MEKFTLPTTLTLPMKLPQVRSLPTIGAVATLPRLSSFNAEAIKQTEEQQALLAQQRAKEANYKKITGLKDPNDPYTLNSAVDAIFNRKAKEKHYGEFAEALHKIPILGDIITAVPALFETVWLAPTSNLLTGDLKAYGINGLTNFSETMDILANPVKSLITPLVNQDTADKKYQLPWYERLGASVGFTDEGRYNYDYDTGFWLADFGLELISDPMTAIEIAVGIATGGSTVAAYYGAKETAEVMAEKALKEAGEALTEEAYQKLLKKATRKTAWQMAKDTVELRKAGTKISRMAKSFAKSKSDDAIRAAAQNLDVALRKSKGIVDDSVKSIVNGITDSVKAYGDEASKAFLKELDDFNRIGKYTLADIFQDSVGGKLTKDAKNQIKSLEKQLAQAAAKGDNAAITQLKETMRLVLSDPASIKKYKHSIEVSSDALSLFKEIELTDYMNGLNKLIQDANNYNLLKAVDKIGDVTEAADSALLKFALMGNPTTMGIYFAIKTDAAKRIGNLVSKYIIKSLTNITDWVSAKTVTQVLYELDNILISTQLALKKFNIFSDTDIFDLDFGKEYAQNVYNKTLNWARGFGRPEQYALNSEGVHKPVNILLLSPEERKRHLIHNYDAVYLKKLGISIDDDDLDEIFFKKLNEVGHYGATGERLKEWDLAEYVKSIQVDDATARLQQLYSDFTMTFTKADSVVSSPQAYIKFLADLDTPTAKTTITAVQDSLTSYTDDFTVKAISYALKSDFESLGLAISPGTRRIIADDIVQIYEISDELYSAYSSLELLQAAENEYLTIKTQMETIKDLQFKLRSRASKLKLDLSKVPNATIKQSKFAEQYRQIEKILSPYFGHKETLVENSKILYELRGNAQLVTQKVLESPEFQELVTAFRAGNDGNKLLTMNISEAKVALKNSELSEKQLEQAISELNDIEKIQNFFVSVDNYVELVSMMKQSQVPAVIQDVFLDTLQNFEIKYATTFAQCFDANLYRFVQQMDVGLAGRYQTHRFTPEYYATKLLEDETYESKAHKYLSSNRTALDEAEFMEALFDSQLLPELSKTRKVIVNGQEVEEFVNQSWLKNRNRTRVYLNFKTYGDNPSIDAVNDIGLYCPALKKSWDYTTSFDETTALLELYKELKTISEANESEEFVFIFQNNQNLDISFIKRRFSEAAEVAQASENFELSEELIRARDWISRVLNSRSLNNITLLKELDGVPSVGKYHSEIKRWMTAIVNSQSQANSTMMLYLNEDIFDLIEKFPPLDASAYKEIKNALVNLVHECNEAKYLWSARMGTVALDGTFLLDGDIYKPSKELLFDDKENIRSLLQSNEVYIPDKTELLELKEDRWYYKQQALPEGLENANAAVRYLKAQGIEYAPSWRALNLKQQLSTYPVLINGNVSMQTIEGVAPVAFRRYVDTDIMEDFFDITRASYQEQHTATRLAQQMSTILSRIRNTSIIDKYEELISKHYAEIIEYAKAEPSWNLYKNLKEVTDVYHKYAALVVLVKDDTAGKPKYKLKSLLASTKVKPKQITLDDLFAMGHQKPIKPSVLDEADLNLKPVVDTTNLKYKEKPKWDEKALQAQYKSEPAYEPEWLLKRHSHKRPITLTLDEMRNDPAQPRPYQFKYKSEYNRAYKKYWKDYRKRLDYQNRRIKAELNKIKAHNLRADALRNEIAAVKAHNAKVFADYKAAYEAELAAVNTHNDLVRSLFDETLKNERYNLELLAKYNTEKDKEFKAYFQSMQNLDEVRQSLQEIENEKARKLSATYALNNSELSELIYGYSEVYKNSKFQQLFVDYDKLSYFGYSDNIYSKKEYLAHIYDSEQKGITYAARDLQKAFERDSNSILDATETLKRGLDQNKVYAPVMQRHAVIGQSHIELNNTYIEVVGNLRDGIELDTFVACDKQIVNNLEDLIVEKVCGFNTTDLTSFVYHQGKGVVIIPVASYITDTSPHSFDLKDVATAFAERYKNYEDELIKVVRSDGDLIIYAKNYQSHIKQELVPYKPMVDIDYDLAFKSAFGYPKTDLSWEHFELNAIQGSLPENVGSHYNIILERLIKTKQDAIQAGASVKQLEFLLTHFEDIEKLRKAHLQHQNTLTRLATDFDDQYSFMRGGYGRILDSSQVNELAEALPKEVREAVFGGELPEKSFYNTSEHMFNFSTLGRAAYRKKYEHFATSNYQSILAQTYRALNNNLSSAAQYASFYYNATEEMTQAIPGAHHLVGTPVPSTGDPSMVEVDQPTTPWGLDNIFRDVSDEEVCNVLKNKDEFTVSYLGVDKKGQPHVETISIVTPEDVAFARSKGAILLPSTTAGSVIQTMNNKRWANSKFKLFHKINYFLKACMLIHPGFIFRNFVDSTLKNYLVSKDAVSMSTSYVEAMDYYTRYKETVNMLFAMNPDSPFRPDTLQIVFADSTAPMSEEMFMLVHNFIESGPSAGSINKVSQFYLKKAAKPSLVNQMYDALLQPTKGLEQITRLAAYLEFIKKGMTNTDAFQAITKTHFDYAAKTATTRWIELVIPFYSFQAKNFEFWLDFLNKSPVLAYTLSKYFQSVWNWEEIDFERIDYYQSQLNHIMQANIQLNKQGLTLKVNPSFMDPINIISNPIDSFASRVSPIFKPIVDAIQGKQPYGYEQNIGSAVGAVASAIPGVGGAIGGVTAIASQTANRYESGYRSYQRTGSPLPLIAPSIFGSVKTPAQYGRASYTNSRAFMDPQKRVPRRVSTYNKLYTDTGKNRWQLRYLPIDNFTVQWRIRESTNRFR